MIDLILAAECGRSDGAPSDRWKRTPGGAWQTLTKDREVDWRIKPPGPDEPHRLQRWRDGFRTVKEFDSMRAAMEWADLHDEEYP
jgi:hypothetical protein